MLQGGGDWSRRIYQQDRSSRPHRGSYTLGCSESGCRFLDTWCRTRCTACWRGIFLLFRTKHSQAVRSSGYEINTVKRCDCFVYRTAWGSSSSLASHPHKRTDGSTPIWWNTWTERLCCCCCMCLWHRCPRRHRGQPVSGSPRWQILTVCAYRGFSAGRDLG